MRHCICATQQKTKTARQRRRKREEKTGTRRDFVRRRSAEEQRCEPRRACIPPLLALDSSAGKETKSKMWGEVGLKREGAGIRGLCHRGRKYCSPSVFKPSNNLKPQSSEAWDPHWLVILNQISALGWLLSVCVCVGPYTHAEPLLDSKLLTVENNWSVHLQAYQPLFECTTSHQHDPSCSPLTPSHSCFAFCFIPVSFSSYRLFLS